MNLQLLCFCRELYNPGFLRLYALWFIASLIVKKMPGSPGNVYLVQYFFN